MQPAAGSTRQRWLGRATRLSSTARVQQAKRSSPDSTSRRTRQSRRVRRSACKGRTHDGASSRRLSQHSKRPSFAAVTQPGWQQRQPHVAAPAETETAACREARSSGSASAGSAPVQRPRLPAARGTSASSRRSGQSRPESRGVDWGWYDVWGGGMWCWHQQQQAGQPRGCAAVPDVMRWPDSQAAGSSCWHSYCTLQTQGHQVLRQAAVC